MNSTTTWYMFLYFQGHTSKFNWGTIWHLYSRNTSNRNGSIKFLFKKGFEIPCKKKKSLEHVYIWRPAIWNYKPDLIRLKALISIWKMNYLGVFALTLVLLSIEIQARPEKSFIFMLFLQNKILIINFKNPM